MSCDGDLLYGCEFAVSSELAVKFVGGLACLL